MLFLIQTVIAAVPVGIGAFVAAGLLSRQDETDQYAALVRTAIVILAGAAIVVIPWLRTRRWRYELRTDELEIQHGTFAVTNTVIPISRIQHVDIERTPISRMLDLVELGIHTAGESHEIPALDEAVAARLRDTIADQLHEPDEL